MPESTTEIVDWMLGNAGYEQWVEFCKTFGGQDWWIPKAPALIDRDMQIQKLYEDLMRTPNVKEAVVLSKLANRFEISVKTFKRIVSKNAVFYLN